MILSNALEDAKTVAEVVSIINSGTVEGMSEAGGTEFTPEMLAGQYAAGECEEAKNDATVFDLFVEVNLDFIADAGAKFDYSKAADYALAIHKEKLKAKP
jgi:hypothetical protein